MVDLENEGQTHLCMTFCISGCKRHTDMIFVSILIFSRPVISKMLKHIKYLNCLILELKVIHIFRMTLLISGCVHAIDSILVSILIIIHIICLNRSMIESVSRIQPVMNKGSK